eukprot:m.4011 g.4011  ORF g.4011 m.4011 type:complete len:188 (+) comp2159_c0_seq1:262-825(+)
MSGKQYTSSQPLLKDGSDFDVDRSEYPNQWEAGFWTAPCMDPLYFCFALACSPCSAFHLRQRLYGYDMSRYECCAGTYKLPCECCYCRDSDLPVVLLCCEVMLFHPCSIMGTRMALQDELQLKNTCCDNVLLAIIGFVRLLAQILKWIGCRAQAECCTCLGDTVFTCVCACIQTQNKLQLDYRDGVY